MQLRKILGKVRNDLGVQLLALYSVFIIPIIIGALLFDQAAGDRLREEIKASDLALARAIAQETNTIIENALTAVEQLSTYPAVRESSIEEINTIFENFQIGRPDVNLIYRLDENGIMVFHYPTGPISTVDTDFSFREYFQQAKASPTAFISLGRISPTTEQPVATAVMPVWSDNTFKGVVATNIKLQSLSDTLNSIAMEYQDDAELQIVIIDSGGKVIANPNPEYLLTNYLILKPTLSQDVLNGVSGNQVAEDRNGVENLYSYVPVPSAGWGVVISRPTNIAFATPDSFHRGVLLMIGAFLAIGIYFWSVLFFRVLTPLERLASFSHTIGKKGTASRNDNILKDYSARPDQIGHLVRSFRRMEKAIQARINELSTLVETSQAVVSSLDSNIVLNRILEQVEHLLGITKSAIVALDKNEGAFVPKASRGLSTRYTEGLILSPEESSSLTLRSIRTGEPIIIQDTETDPSFETYRPRASAEGYRSFAAIPLKTIYAPQAALILYSSEPHKFTENNIELLVTFANQATMAIENAELFSHSDARLQEQTRRLEALIQSLDVGLVLENLAGNVIYVNRSIAKLVDKPSDQLTGSPVISLYKEILNNSESTPEDLKEVKSLLSEVNEKEISLSIQVGASIRYYRLKGFTVNDTTGQLIGRGQILQDITKDYELDRMKSSLISTVSHELRTPLAAIKGYATTLLADDVNWEENAKTEFIQIISDETDRLGGLVNNLLDLSRIEAGNLVLTPRSCDLREIIHRGVSRAYPHPGERIQYDIPEKLPSIEADPQRLEVVIRNLVENAAKYANNNLPITIHVEINEEEVIVKIQDQGPGIPIENQKEVFKSFYRIDNGLTRNSQGVGLGLAISRGFIAAHQGRIWFEPQETGTCVAFSLPQKQLHLNDTQKIDQSTVRVNK